MKKLIHVVVIAALMLSLMSCGTAETISNNTIQISNSDDTKSVSYETYESLTLAKSAPITYYADESDFPIKVIIFADKGEPDEYEFSSYGIQKPYDAYSGLGGSGETWAYLIIKPYPETEESPETEKATSLDADLETKADSEEPINADDPTEPAKVDAADSDYPEGLLEEPTSTSLHDPETIHGQELQRFLDGEWDGAMRTDTVDFEGTTYKIDRDCNMRTYFWHRYNPITGEESCVILSIDYDGPLETVGGALPQEDYSLVIDYENNIITQWRLLEKQDSWRLTLADGEIIDYVIAYADEDTCGIVRTIDADEQGHVYKLKTDGLIQKDF